MKTKLFCTATILASALLLAAGETPTAKNASPEFERMKTLVGTSTGKTADRAMIAQGMFHLARSAAGDEVSQYHLEAGIAACHGTAADYAATDWRRILGLYDRLIDFDHSPVVALNRAVALAEVLGPDAGIAAVHAIPSLQDLRDYHLFHAVLGEFETRLQHAEAAATHFRKAFNNALSP
jgi:predicted RNA polymerase sigma factor